MQGFAATARQERYLRCFHSLQYCSGNCIIELGFYLAYGALILLKYPQTTIRQSAQVQHFPGVHPAIPSFLRYSTVVARLKLQGIVKKNIC
jgi:hypothetical protein